MIDRSRCERFINDPRDVVTTDTRQTSDLWCADTSSHAIVLWVQALRPIEREGVTAVVEL